MTMPTAMTSTTIEPTVQQASIALHWMSVVSHLDPRFGGLSSVVPKLSSSVASQECMVDLAAFCGPDEACAPSLCPKLQLTEWPISRVAWLKDQHLSQRFNLLVSRMDGLHIHGLWEQSTFAAARAARMHQLPYVLSAHGMLEPWALNNKRLKKILYSAAIERNNIQRASCLHALTHAEALDYRRYGATAPIAVIPNGVDIPTHLSPDSFFAQYPALQGKRIVLFLGRIHFKKGLDILIDAWKHIAPTYPEAHLVLAGPDFEHTQARVVSMIQQNRLNNSVTLTGMLDQSLKWSAFAAAECFVLPSYSEGLSVSTLEAMGAGLPVILTDRCNLPEVAEIDAGLVIPARTKPLQHALEDILSNTVATNHAIGQRGRAHILTHYTWSRVAKQMSELYMWLAGGPAPALTELQTTGGGS